MSAGTCRAWPDSNTKAVKITGSDLTGEQVLEKSISTLWYTDIVISFCYKWDTLESGEWVIVEYTVDGTNWNQLKSIDDTTVAHMFYAANDTEIAISNGVGVIPNPILTPRERLSSYYLALPTNAGNSPLFSIRMRETMNSANDFVWIDDFDVFWNIITTSDTLPPTVDFTSPLSGSTLSWIVNLTSTVSDDSGTFSIHYMLENGTHISPDSTTSPFTFAFDTRTLSGGVYTLIAHASDPSGNQTMKRVSVVIDNSISTPSPTNLVENPSVEVSDGDTPLSWYKWWYGNNTALFTYPAPGILGEKSVEVSLTSHVDGDTKWYFKDIPVTPWVEYTYSQKYSSDVVSSLFARYQFTPWVYSYNFLQSIPVSEDPSELSVTLTPPPWVTSMTVWNALSSIGKVRLDDVRVTTE
jgi:hypothetical protein